jgi:two-component system sensor histidine kinase CpxA
MRHLPAQPRRRKLDRETASPLPAVQRRRRSRPPLGQCPFARLGQCVGRALGNLLRNAIRCVGAAGTISVTARRDGTTIILVIEDEGPGVPAEALARLGEPFYRPDVARTREAGGVGLGLPIVRSAVAACVGEASFSNRTPQRFRAEIRLIAA